MRRLLLLSLALFACKRDPAGDASGPSSPSTKDADALWALAPDGALLGAVASPRALQLTEGAFTRIRALLKTAPELAALGAQLDHALVATGGDLTKLADIGLDTSQGFAYFMAENKSSIVFIPVKDRDLFLARVHGTKGTTTDKIDDAVCKPTSHGYACATSEAMFDRVGKGTPALRTSLDLVKARGDIELAGSPALARGTVDGFAGVMQLDRGALVLRVAVKGLPAQVTAKIVNAKPRADSEHTAAFAVANLAPFLANLPPAPLPGGITMTDIVHSFDGPLTVTLAAGEQVVDARIPLNDPAPATTLIGHCRELAPLGILADQQIPGTCRVKVAQLGQELDIWVDGKELRVGAKTQKEGAKVALTPVGAEIASGEWAFAAWGRGTMFAAAAQPLPGLSQLPDEAAMIVRAISMLDEMGTAVKLDGDVLRVLVNVRTIWANPDEVVTKLLAIAPADVGAGRAGEASKAIAVASPNTPFAADFEAGQSGMLIPTAVVGMLAAVAVPTFMQYMERAKQRDAPAPPE